MLKYLRDLGVRSRFVFGLDFRWVLLVLFAVQSLGCGGGVSDERESNLGLLTALYSRCVIQNRGKPPANKEELVQFINEKGQKILDTGKVDDVESLFVSPRDNQPYVIRFGKQAMLKYSSGLVVCEQVGVDGKRLVGYSNGGVEEMDEEEIKELGFKEAFSD